MISFFFNMLLHGLPGQLLFEQDQRDNLGCLVRIIHETVRLPVCAEGNVTGIDAYLLIVAVINTASFNKLVSIRFALMLVEPDLAAGLNDRMLEDTAFLVHFLPPVQDRLSQDIPRSASHVLCPDRLICDFSDK